MKARNFNNKQPQRKGAAPTAKRPRLLAVLAALICLVLAGSLLFAFQHDRIEQWEYPQKYSEYVEYYAGKYALDPLLLYSFIRTESNFSPGAESKAGARGLMQITEVTFDWIKSKIAPTEDLTFDDLYDPETNIRFGSYFVSYCLLRYQQDIATAAAAYHSGWGTVDGLLADSKYSPDGKVLTTFPYTQMRLYVHKITTSYAQYQSIYPQ
ncbi:MAG: lytic transglycosylase domain-containing protein [Gemmiger sp.]|nr:lytic transglycosylase domain-containing protein [Gemmiger sp.]